MWISNTATVLMLLPVAIAVIESAERKELLQVPLLLGLAWSCSIGGLGTPIGTPPNLIFMQVYQDTTGQQLGFIQWMSLGGPYRSGDADGCRCVDYKIIAPRVERSCSPTRAMAKRRAPGACHFWHHGLGLDDSC